MLQDQLGGQNYFASWRTLPTLSERVLRLSGKRPSMLSLTGKDLRKAGFPQGPAIGMAIKAMQSHFPHYAKKEAIALLKKVIIQPETYLNDERLSEVAALLRPQPKQPNDEIPLRGDQVPTVIFGADQIEGGALLQMENAARLPVAVAGALMPDAHAGYGLPIGGVLATKNAVIPYGVGVDIGCRMCLSVYPLPPSMLQTDQKQLKKMLNTHTLFGAGKAFSEKEDHEVLERKEFYESGLLRNLHSKAAAQLGTSGSGNHFVEFGRLEIKEKDDVLGLEPGAYLALLSHSGSRGLGATIANHFTKLAMSLRKLPSEARHLAWLDLNEESGQEYWLAMNLAGDYASACHHVIHEKIACALGEQPIKMVENHHNFAWKETHFNEELIVHRKGATPAGKNMLGIIPGSMTLPGFIVRGKGNETSLSSASHGAGRQMSRTAAKKSISQQQLKDTLAEAGVVLIGGGLDEAPQAYKNIHEVMAAQQELVEVLGRFWPGVVRMDA